MVSNPPSDKSSSDAHLLHLNTHLHLRPAVAIAILYHNCAEGEPQFLMQLRDDIAGIAYPGHWGFFGGHLEPGESADEAIRRELLEEIGYAPPHLEPFDVFETPNSIRHVYTAPLTLPISRLTLQEGWDMALFTIAEVKYGKRFSAKANQVKPMGEPHQKLLLLFIERWLTQSARQ